MTEVEYELTPDDLKAFQRHHAKHPPAPRGRQGVGLLVAYGLFAAFIIGLFALNAAPHYLFYYAPYVGYSPLLFRLVALAPGIALGAMLTLVGLLVCLRLFLGGANRKALREGRNAEKALGWRRLAIDPHAIRTSSAFSSVANYWEGIDAVVATKDHVFLYITTRAAHVVPRRAFPDERAFQEFVETARRYARISRLGDGGGRPRGPQGDPRPAAPPPAAEASPDGGERIATKPRPSKGTTAGPAGPAA